MKDKDLINKSYEIFNKIKTDYGIQDSGGLLLLETAREAWVQVKKNEAILDKTGWVVDDRFKQPKTNPAAAVMRDCRAQMLQAIKLLNLEIKLSEE